MPAVCLRYHCLQLLMQPLSAISYWVVTLTPTPPLTSNPRPLPPNAGPTFERWNHEEQAARRRILCEQGRVRKDVKTGRF